MISVKPTSEKQPSENPTPEAATDLTAKEYKAFVLLSGGLDSTTALHKAIFDYKNAEAVSINYGQRHRKEMEYAHRTCDKLGIKHTIIDLPADILGGGSVMLTDTTILIPNVSYSDLPYGVSPTYVPYRNGNLLALITSHAQKWVNEAFDHREAGVYFGAHSEDAHNWAYPDCTPEFIGAQANAIYIGSYYKIRLHTPLMWLYKSDVVKLGHELGVDFSLTWSCYKGEAQHCGICPTCRSRRQAFIDANIDDPTEYSTPVMEPA